MPGRRRPAMLAHYLRRVDLKLLHHSHRARSATLDRRLIGVTRAANHSQLWLAIAAALAVLGGQRGRRASRSGLLAVAIAAAVANGPLKLAFRRRRPPSRPRAPLIPMPRSTSFPSGHSAAAFAFATGASARLPLLGPLLFPLAGAVAYSRVHIGVHFPSDVLIGSGIGVAAGVAAARLQPHEPSQPWDVPVRTARASAPATGGSAPATSGSAPATGGSAPL
jgi:membrane-associated phospholipid phosphatase